MGIFLMLLASASFATMSAFIKALGQGIPPSELVFLRCFLALPLLLLFIRIRKRPLWVRARRVLFFRTLFGLLAMLGFFYALTHMPLADCIFLGRSQPLFLSLMAPLVIRERVPKSAWFAILTGLIGIAMILKPAMTWPTAAWAALGAAAASALAHLMVRRLNATDFPLVIVFNFTLLTTLVTSLWVLPGFIMPSPHQWVFLLGVALFAGTGQLLMTLAYQKDRAPAVASASYASIILAVLYGYLIWGEVPRPMAWLGGGLIVSGGLLLLKARIHVNEPASPAAT